MKEQQQKFEELCREIRYLRSCTERATARLLAADVKAIAMRYELEQKRRGFSLMASLAFTLEQDTDYSNVLVSVSQRINAALDMQRTVVLVPDNEREFRIIVSKGYPSEEWKDIEAQRIEVEAEILDSRQPVLITGADPDNRLASLRKALRLPYLICVPILLQDSLVALLVTGRLREQRPFMPRLGRSDVDTLQTVGAYLAAMLARDRLRQVETLVNRDPLTQLPNLRWMMEYLGMALIDARRDNYMTAIMFLDLDGFKVVNDTHGHAVGDMVLRVVADRLKRCVRDADFVGRIGGDEFVIILSRIGNPKNAGIVAEKVINVLSEPIDAEGVFCQIGVSIGISVFPENGEEISVLLAAADKAMYEVKSHGKNAFRYAEK